MKFQPRKEPMSNSSLPKLLNVYIFLFAELEKIMSDAEAAKAIEAQSNENNGKKEEQTANQ